MRAGKQILYMLLALLPITVSAQTYDDSLLAFRENYKISLLHSSHPLKAGDTAYLRFYPPNADYRVNGTFVQTTGTRPFLMNTMHGGNKPAVRDYGVITFILNGATLTLTVYRLMTRPEDNTDESIRLFIPFNDNTNYQKTFGGGRYLDISANDLRRGNVVLDFNKAYNPHTAYEKGYPYIMPPKVNSLPVEIKAGEKIFGNNPGY